MYRSANKVLYTLIGLGNGNSIHADILFATPKCCSSNRAFSDNHAFC